MKIRVLLAVFLFMGWMHAADAQKPVKKAVKKKSLLTKVGDVVLKPAVDTTKRPVTDSVQKSGTALNQVISVIGNQNNSNSGSEVDVVGGLKQALEVGAVNSVLRLNKLDGFFSDTAIKIIMPNEAKNVEATLRKFGLGNQVDKAVLSMNRAAEDAAGGAKDIFLDAIKQMTFQDAWQILRGGDFAATDYLKKTTTTALTARFRPVIEQSLAKVDATKYWNTVFSNYNRFSTQKINPDLAAYVTERALNGLFQKIALEEKQIRKDPAARVTGLLQQVFGKQ